MNTSRHQLGKKQSGISMVEILVALVISLFLLGGIIQVYLANKTTYAFTNANSRIQENARFAMDTMVLDLRMAGFRGCAIFDPLDTSSVVNNLNPNGAGYSDTLHDFVNRAAIEGTNNDGLNGADSVTLRGAKPGQVNVHPPFNTSTSAMIHVTANDDVKPGDIVMVSNCRGADIFEVTNTTNSTKASQNAVVHNTGASANGPGNYNPDNCKGGNAHCLSQTYGADAALFKLQAVTYSIKAGESGEPALWRSENGVDEELIDGIEQMQVLFGLDTDDDDYPNRYVVSTAVDTATTDSTDIMSVRLMLLARSAQDFITDKPQIYNFNGVETTANDRRLRQVFTTTIALRNRVGAGI